jgi:hypothetical protein
VNKPKEQPKKKREAKASDKKGKPQLALTVREAKKLLEASKVINVPMKTRSARPSAPGSPLKRVRKN